MWARLAYRKCWPLACAAACKSGTRKARMDCTTWGGRLLSKWAVSAVMAGVGLRGDAGKTGVVVGGVVAGIRPGGLPAAADDAPRPPAAFARGFDGVFAVVATFFGRQQALAVAKDAAVFVVGKGATVVDALIGGAGLHGQLGQADLAGRLVSAGGVQHAGCQRGRHQPPAAGCYKVCSTLRK